MYVTNEFSCHLSYWYSETSNGITLCKSFPRCFLACFFVKVVKLENSSHQPGILRLQGRRGAPYSMVHWVGWRTRTAFVVAAFPGWICSTMQDRSWAPHGQVKCCCGKFSQQASVSACPKVGARRVVRLQGTLWLAQDILFQQGVMYINASPYHSNVPMNQKKWLYIYYTLSIGFHSDGINPTKVRAECLSLLAGSQVAQTPPESQCLAQVVIFKNRGENAGTIQARANWLPWGRHFTPSFQNSVVQAKTSNSTIKNSHPSWC